MKKGQININYKPRNIAILNKEALVGQADRYSTIEYKAIIAYAAKAAAVPESSVEMAMEAIFDAMNYFVLNGHSVQIPNLGTFSIGVRAKSAASEQSFQNNFAQNLRNVKINFLPDPELKQMLASTSIKTTSEIPDGYSSASVISVSGAMFKRGDLAVPINEGLCYALDQVTALEFRGSRLVEKFIGENPVYITFINADGDEVEYHVTSARAIIQSYDSISIDMRWIKNNNSAFKYIKKIELKNLKAADAVLYAKTLGTPVAGVPAIGALVVDEVPAVPGATLDYVAGKAVKVQIFGANLAAVENFYAGSTQMEVSTASIGYAECEFTPANSGNYPIFGKYNEEQDSTNVYNISFGQAGGTSITSVTANNDPLVNGGSTNITAGNSYNLSIVGSGLGELTAANFTLPQGSTLSITSQSDTMIAATIANAQAGAFKVTVDEVDIFTATLVAVQPSASVTGYKLTENGATQSLSTSVQADDGGAFSIYLVGTGLDGLTDDNFSGTNLTISEYDSETHNVVGTLNGAASTTLIVTVDETTIATIGISPYQDDNGQPIDTGD
jgi:nucleoid DNA-binding protein